MPAHRRRKLDAPVPHSARCAPTRLPAARPAVTIPAAQARPLSAWLPGACLTSHVGGQGRPTASPVEAANVKPSAPTADRPNVRLPLLWVPLAHRSCKLANPRLPPARRRAPPARLPLRTALASGRRPAAMRAALPLLHRPPAASPTQQSTTHAHPTKPLQMQRKNLASQEKRGERNAHKSITCCARARVLECALALPRVARNERWGGAPPRDAGAFARKYAWSAAVVRPTSSGNAAAHRTSSA